MITERSEESGLRSLVRMYRHQFEQARMRRDHVSAIRASRRVDRAEKDLHLCLYGVPPWVETADTSKVYG